jgi:hypothetical protein
MTINLGHNVTATRDHSRAAAWRVYVNGLLFARVDTAAIARCIRANRAAQR